MAGSGLTNWVPWRGANPVRWTLAFALSLLGILTAAVLPRPARSGWSGSVPALLGIAAIVTAVSAGPAQGRARWPWRGPYPVRDTLALALFLVALVVYFGDLAWRRYAVSGEEWARTSLVNAITLTLLFASAVASREHGRWFRWLNRSAWGILAAASWWTWHGLVTRASER
jgi:hypothetical protein